MFFPGPILPESACSHDPLFRVRALSSKDLLLFHYSGLASTKIMGQVCDCYAMGYSLNSLKGGSIGEGILGVMTMAPMG